MVKSIRWRLQMWYALILLLVVAGFASALYYQIGRARLDEIDADLHAAARALEGTLRGLPPHATDPHFPPKLGPRKGPRPPPGDHMLRGLDLPPDLGAVEGGGRGLYFVILRNNGRVLRSTTLPNVPTFPFRVPPPGEPPSVRERGSLRELILAGPHGTVILVGRDVSREQRGRAALGWTLSLTGLGVWAVGLVGGWLLSSHLLRPIETIAATAATISAGSLSRRIDVAEVDSELGRLAAVLNATFTRLEGAFAQQTRFTADASHELRTPLAVLLSQVEWTLARPRSPEEYREALEACGRASMRMKQLVEALLALARADADHARTEHHPLDLADIVREAVDLVGPLAEERKIQFDLEAPEAWVWGDSSGLSRVVLNLLTNAIHYNRDGGRVEVRLDRGEGAVRLSVADTGCGIPREDQEHVFERFFRADRARSRELGGCGLGLAICKSIVDVHEGSIGFTSEPGAGTRFVVRLRPAHRP